MDVNLLLAWYVSAYSIFHSCACFYTCSHVVATLKQGQAVRAEQFDEVTVCFSAITDFPDIASQSSPIEVRMYRAR